MKNIIVFLTVKPCLDFYNFTKKLVKDKYDVYICIDDNNYKIQNYDNVIPLIYINNKECEDAGFKDTVSYCPNKACSRDKALYYFVKNKIDYKYIWFIEDDVFIPTVNTISDIDKKYECDLLCSPIEEKVESEKEMMKSKWCHWKKKGSKIKLNFPWVHGMICAIRVSRNMIDCIANYAKKYKSLFFCEIMFQTLAIQNNLSIIHPYELYTIFYIMKWEKDDIKPFHLYHPIKDYKTHSYFRSEKLIIKNNLEDWMIHKK